MDTSKPGRNAPCPCGSGKKYKQCCAGRTVQKTQKRTKWLAIALAGLLAAGALGFVHALSRSDSSEGPVRVWSAEHGHWH